MRLPIGLILSLNLLLISSCTAPVKLNNLRVANVTIEDSALIGRDFLAAQQPNFNISSANKYVGRTKAIGSLDHTFGRSLTPIRSLLSSLTPKIYRVHIINAVCVRNGNCGSYEIGFPYTVASFSRAIERRDAKIIRFIRNRTAEYKRLSQDFPGIEFWLSPALEHNLTPRAYRILADNVLNVWPGVRLVNSEQNCSGERYKGALRECHGNTSGGDISSLDGTDVTDIDVVGWLRRTRNQRVRFVWSRPDNCRTQGAFLDPRKRTACPKDYQFEELAHEADIRPPAPPRVGLFVNCKDLTTPWKPFAEDKGTGDQRANLPVVIIPGSQAAAHVFAIDGTDLGVLTYYGKFTTPGLNRYYSGWVGGSRKNGYGFEKEAALHGSPWVYLKQGKVCYGPYIPGRRAGSFRD